MNKTIFTQGVSLANNFQGVSKFTKLTTLAIILSAIGLLTSPLHRVNTAYAANPDTAAACFYYSTYNNEVTITGYHQGSANSPCPRDVSIPSTLGGNPVTTIDYSAFEFDELTSVTIPSSVTTINDSAFDSNKLISVTIEGDISSVGYGIFTNNPITSFSYNGTNYTSSDQLGEACYQFNTGTGTIAGFNFADIPTIKNDHQACINPNMTVPGTLGGVSVKAIGDNALYGINLNSVIIPSSVTTIGYAALGGNQLTSVTIPNSVTKIGTQAFFNNQLTSVTIPSSVTNIGNAAFSGNKLVSVTFEGDITTAGTGLFAGNPIASFSYNGTTYTSSDPLGEACYDFDSGTGTITGFNFADIPTIKNDHQTCLNKQLTIPSTIGGVSVNAIGNLAFSSNQFTSVIIPSSVTSIGSQAFYYSQISSVTIPGSVTTIGNYAFSNNQLTSVIIPSSVTSIGVQAFRFNDLTSVIIPSSVTSIGSSVFGNNKLTSVSIPNSVTSIGNGAFANNLLTSVTIPSSVANISALAFYDNKLVTVTIDGDITTVGQRVFDGSLITRLSYNGTTYTNSDPTGEACFNFDGAGTVTDFNFADLATIKSGHQACLNRNITIPSTIGGVPVTTIGNSALSNSQLTSVIIPSSVTTIGNNAFYNNQITSVIIPTSVTALDNSAFDSNPVTSDGQGGYLLNQLATPSPTASQPTIVTTPIGTTLNCIYPSSESSLASSDNVYTYPLGLIDFCFSTSQSVNRVSVTFQTDLKPNEVTPRKYNPTTKKYSDLPASTNPIVTETNSNGHHTLTLTYTIIDNGSLDLDPTSGSIQDPIGLATTTSAVESTGTASADVDAGRATGELADTGEGIGILACGALGIMFASAIGLRRRNTGARHKT